MPSSMKNMATQLPCRYTFTHFTSRQVPLSDFFLSERAWTPWLLSVCSSNAHYFNWCPSECHCQNQKQLFLALTRLSGWFGVEAELSMASKAQASWGRVYMLKRGTDGSTAGHSHHSSQGRLHKAELCTAGAEEGSASPNSAHCYSRLQPPN